jgi:hypothetical protein
MEIVGLIVGVIAALLVLKFIKGMLKFAVLAVLIVVALFMGGVFN